MRPAHGAPGDALTDGPPDESGAARAARGSRALDGGHQQRQGDRRPGGNSARGQARAGPAPSRSDGTRAGNFVRESIGELRKVEWPTQNHLIQGTVVVIVACVVMGTYLYFADMIFNKLVSKLLLGQ